MASTRKKAAKVKKKTKGKKKKKIIKVILNKKTVKKSKKITVKTRPLKKTQKKGKKMSTETIKSGRSPLLDTSHLKVKFPFKESLFTSLLIILIIFLDNLDLPSVGPKGLKVFILDIINFNIITTYRLFFNSK